MVKSGSHADKYYMYMYPIKCYTEFITIIKYGNCTL